MSDNTHIPFVPAPLPPSEPPPAARATETVTTTTTSTSTPSGTNALVPVPHQDSAAVWNALASNFGPIVISGFALVLNCILILLMYLMHDKDLMLLVAGATMANATSVIQYWVGSSKDSANKTALLATQLQSPVLAPPSAKQV